MKVEGFTDFLILVYLILGSTWGWVWLILEAGK
jgi:hypothetical protein